MMEPSPNSPSRITRILSAISYRSDLRVVVRLMGILLVLAYALFLVHWGTSYASSSDASGYFNSAKLFSEYRLWEPVRTIPDLKPPNWDYYFQQPLGFKPVGREAYLAPTYPIGLPIMLLIASLVVGWNFAAILINVLSALGCGWLLTRLGREYCGLRSSWSVFAVLLLWLCPLFIFLSLQPMSDAPATFWTLATLYAAIRARLVARWGWLVGTALGMAVLVRPTNALLLLPTAFLLGLNWRAWLTCGLSGLPFAFALIAYNIATYGQALTSGYGNVSDLFSSRFLLHNLVHFAQWIPQLLSPLIVLALGFPWLPCEHRRVAFALLTWCVALIGFYAFYYHSGETWWYLRFILPAFPGLILLSVMIIQRICDRLTSTLVRTAILGVLMLLAALQLSFTSRRLQVLQVRAAETGYYHAITWLDKNVPDRAVMAAMQMSGALHFYTQHPLIRYDLVTPNQFASAVAAAKAEGLEIYAPLFPFELARLVDANLGGTWEKVATVDYITIWRLKS